MKPALTVAVGLIVGLTANPRASAQTPEELDIQVYAGLTIIGEVGKVYSIEDPAQIFPTPMGQSLGVAWSFCSFPLTHICGPTSLPL